MKKLPKEITLCKLECILMPQGEVICCGKTVGWFKDLKSYLELDQSETTEAECNEAEERSRGKF